MDAILFWIAGIIAIVASWFVVTRRNPVYSAIFLVLFFAMISLQFLILRAPFLAVVQLLVYAGAIMVLFLFVLMLLNLTPEELKENVSRSRKVVAAIGSAGLFLLLAGTVRKSPTVQGAGDLTGDVSGPLEGAGEIAAIAESLFSIHLLPFELTSFLILIAIIGAIYLTRSPGSIPEATTGASAGGEAEAVGGADEKAVTGEAPGSDSPSSGGAT